MFRKPRRRRAMKIPVRQRILVVGALVILVIAGALGRSRWSREPASVLRASGTIEATEVSVSFKIPGRVIERPVEEGDRLGAAPRLPAGDGDPAAPASD
jgi:HlyD family secretion protein